MMITQNNTDFIFNHMSEVRFKEIELYMFFDEMKNRFGPAKSKKLVTKLFESVGDIDTHDIIEAYEGLYRVHHAPQKHEKVIFYIFYLDMSQYQVRKLSNLSPNYIQQARNKFIESPHDLTPLAMDNAITLFDSYLEVKNLLAIHDKINFEK